MMGCRVRKYGIVRWWVTSIWWKQQGTDCGIWVLGIGSGTDAEGQGWVCQYPSYLLVSLRVMDLMGTENTDIWVLILEYLIQTTI